MLQRFHWLLPMLLSFPTTYTSSLIRVVIVSAEEGALDHELFLGGAEERCRRENLIIGGLVAKRLRWQGKILEVELHGFGDTVDQLESEPLVVFVGHLDRRDARV